MKPFERQNQTIEISDSWLIHSKEVVYIFEIYQAEERKMISQNATEPKRIEG